MYLLHAVFIDYPPPGSYPKGSDTRETGGRTGNRKDNALWDFVKAKGKVLRVRPVPIVNSTSIRRSNHHDYTPPPPFPP